MFCFFTLTFFAITPRALSDSEVDVGSLVRGHFPQFGLLLRGSANADALFNFKDDGTLEGHQKLKYCCRE